MAVSIRGTLNSVNVILVGADGSPSRRDRSGSSAFRSCETTPYSRYVLFFGVGRPERIRRPGASAAAEQLVHRFGISLVECVLARPTSPGASARWTAGRALIIATHAVSQAWATAGPSLRGALAFLARARTSGSKYR